MTHPAFPIPPPNVLKGLLPGKSAESIGLLPSLQDSLRGMTSAPLRIHGRTASEAGGRMRSSAGGVEGTSQRFGIMSLEGPAAALGERSPATESVAFHELGHMLSNLGSLGKDIRSLPPSAQQHVADEVAKVMWRNTGRIGEPDLPERGGPPLSLSQKEQVEKAILKLLKGIEQDELRR